MSTWQITLETRVRQHNPQRIVVRGEPLLDWIEALNFAERVKLVEELPADMALLSLPGQTVAEIVRLRDLCPKLIVLSESPEGPDFNEFLALGFERIYQSEDSAAQLFEHDIATYKTVPDWLNAKYWAHPERWEP
jgi:Family of unknown function (DUF6231)